MQIYSIGDIGEMMLAAQHFLMHESSQQTFRFRVEVPFLKFRLEMRFEFAKGHDFCTKSEDARGKCAVLQ